MRLTRPNRPTDLSLDEVGGAFRHAARLPNVLVQSLCDVP